MNKKIILLILTGFLFLNCTKKREEKFPTPLELFMLTATHTYDVLKSPKPNAQVLGKITTTDKVQAVATIALVEKNGDQKFLQITCPASLSCEKEGGYIYLNSANISGCKECAEATNSNLTGMLLESSAIEKATQTRDWIQNPKKQIPDSLDEKIFLTCLSVIRNEKDRNSRIMELNILFTALKDPTKLKDPKLETLRSKYSAIDSIFKIFKEGDGSEWEANPLSKIQIPESLSSGIKKMADEQIKNIVTGFPFRGESWVALVKEFNNIKSTVYAQEKILAESVKGAQYVVTTSTGTANASDIKV